MTVLVLSVALVPVLAEVVPEAVVEAVADVAELPLCACTSIAWMSEASCWNALLNAE